MSFVSHKGIQPASYEVSKVVFADKQKTSPLEDISDTLTCKMNGELPAASTDVDVNLYMGKELHIFTATVSTNAGGKKTVTADNSGDYEMAITEDEAGTLKVELDFDAGIDIDEGDQLTLEITSSAKTVALKPDFVAAVLKAAGMDQVNAVLALIPALPSANGTYVLEASVSGDTKTTSWGVKG